VQEPVTVDQRVVPLVESALQAVAEKISDQCSAWYGIGARDVEQVLREAAQYGLVHGALAEREEDHELAAALGWVGGISEPVLDRKVLLRRVAEIARDMQAKTKRAWDVGYDSGLKAASEFAAERRLTDAEIGEVWFEAKIPGLTETQARLLIREAERRLAGEK
jgi:hypothetical protein